jgi:hypothetical protein
LNIHWKLKVFASPVRHYYCVSVLLVNAKNCCNPNQVAQYFILELLTLDEYFHDQM